MYIVGTRFHLRLLCWSLRKHTNRFSEAANVHVLLYIRSSDLTDGLTSQTRIERKGSTQKCLKPRNNEINLKTKNLKMYGYMMV